MRLRLVPIFLTACFLAAGCGSSNGDDTRGTQLVPSRQALVFTHYPKIGKAEITVANVDGSGQRRLAGGSEPRLSPDGLWVAFLRRSCNDPTKRCSDLYLISSRGGKPRLLARDRSDVRWSPDSRRLLALAYTSDSAVSVLFCIDRESGEQTKLARGDFSGRDFSPDGSEVVYGLMRASRQFRQMSDLYVVGADGKGMRRLTKDGKSGYPVWTRNGIAYSRYVTTPPKGDEKYWKKHFVWGADEIWRMDPDGTNRRSISGSLPKRLIGGGIVGLIPIAWSDDGRVVLAAQYNELGGVPYAVFSQSGEIRKLGDFSYHSWPDGLSRDGRFALVDDSENFERTGTYFVSMVPLSGGLGRVIAQRASGASWNR